MENIICNYCKRTEVCEGSYPEGCFLEDQIFKMDEISKSIYLYNKTHEIKCNIMMIPSIHYKEFVYKIKGDFNVLENGDIIYEGVTISYNPHIEKIYTGYIERNIELVNYGHMEVKDSKGELIPINNSFTLFDKTFRFYN